MSDAGLPYVLLLAAMALRTALVLIFLFAAFRLLGRRELGQFNVFDLTTLMTCANAVQNAMTEGRGELGVAAASAGSLILVGAALALLEARHPRLSARLAGGPRVLMRRGHFVEHNLRREGISREEVEVAMRRHGLDDPARVALAVLELDGSVTIVPEE